jgi:hypothetical protein
LSYYFKIINYDFFKKFKYLFFKYDYIKLNLYSLYYYKQIINLFIKKKNIFIDIDLLINRIFYKFFFFFNKNFYFKKY